MTYNLRNRWTVVDTFTEYAAVLLRQRYGDPRITDGSHLLYDCDYAAYGRIADKVHSTFPVCIIDRICEVNAPQMYGMYLLRKEEMQAQSTGRPYGTDVQELELYHVTTESRGTESLQNGLDWRRTTRSKFGRGVSFSDDADYADYYANNTSGEERRVIIVCAVLVADTWRVKTNNKNAKNRWCSPGNALLVPPGTSDTTVSPNGRVYVKYYDYEFYPLYMVYYRRRQEHVAMSRYFTNAAGKQPNNNNNNNRSAQQQQQQQQLQQQQQQQQQQRFTLAELEQQRERERRRQEEQAQQHRLLVQQQQKRREQDRLAEQRRQRQREEAEQRFREERQEEAWRQREQQQRRQQFSRQEENNCLIL